MADGSVLGPRDGTPLTHKEGAFDATLLGSEDASADGMTLGPRDKVGSFDARELGIEDGSALGPRDNEGSFEEADGSRLGPSEGTLLVDKDGSFEGTLLETEGASTDTLGL